MQKIVFLVVFILATVTDVQAQEKIYNSFKTTRVINSHAVDMLKKKELDFRITHRFGDIAGQAGGIHQLFGIDEAADIRIAFEYGITDNLNIGIGRCKGVSPYRGLFDGYVKYRILQQTADNTTPLSLTVVSTINYSSGLAGNNPTIPNMYTSDVQRLSYVSQLLIAYKHGERFTVQLMPSYVHRNLVAFDDTNGLLAVGVATHIKITKLIAVLAEYYYIPKNNERTYLNEKFHAPLALGIEFDTGGHIFHINVTNSMGITETQYIPYTLSDLAQGQYRLGFTISRIFKF